MQEFEKLGQLYLGRTYDLAKKQPAGDLLLYDSKDLVTHALCVGMTGSGKTGLCLALVEEAAIDGVPSLLIDVKGDLGNLLLTFPDLAPEDFAPWVNEDDARRQERSVAQFAADQAALWRNGLAAWGQDGARIARLKNAAEFTIYTPGSTAGAPLSMMDSLAAPRGRLLEDAELLRDRIQTTATGVLGLVGVDADPLRSREHIVLSIILQSAWQQGRDLTLPDLIQQIHTPPVTRVGVMDLDAVFPAADRFALAMSLNNLLAAPGFDVWMQGEPLDIDRMLHTADGRPRVAICSIAHLSDAERMFFVSLLLNQTLAWMRAQPGTTSLRALLYMDEIFGYFPPVANPPSKTPLLTLVKQARAFGVGVVLATQNPVDLDYKGLANTGTWFLGRLQTERDKARVLDGLEGAAAATGRPYDRQTMDHTLSGLGSRIFVMNNVHEPAPVVFESRWTLSYLRGPLGRNEITRLMAGRAAPSAPREVPQTDRPGAVPADPSSVPLMKGPPVLSAAVPQYFAPVRDTGPLVEPRLQPARFIYEPHAYGSAEVRYVDMKLGVDAAVDLSFVTPIGDGAVPVDWSHAAAIDVEPSDLEPEPMPGIEFAALTANAVNAKSIDRWQKDFAAWLYASQTLDLMKAARSGIVSRPGESERDFRIRLQQALREARDEAVEKLRQKYAPKIAAAQERLRRAQQATDRESGQAHAQGLQTAISFGAAFLTAAFGRKVGLSTLGRATTAVRGVGRSIKEAQDIGRAKETVETVEQQVQQLEEELRTETAAIEGQFNAASEPLEPHSVRLKKTNISVRLVALVWVPMQL